ncbi:hypothetical protein PF008_g17526 [Phytophthora fragariae]|uniref:Uncharacterized protein n=1 Tax=Phytophthora fragariae TaxID=53985 RepID=A0A6G0R805_9STRA|nr:hypothetical protein PF008_g17526 [Phytophthora fragariae]
MWRILSSVCITMLCMQRNRAIFQQEVTTVEQNVQECWTTGLRQLQAVGKRELRIPDTILH